MASAFPLPRARHDAAAASQGTVFPFGPLSANSLSATRWTGMETFARLPQARAAHRQKGYNRCTPALDPVPPITHKSRPQSTFFPGCVLRRPVTTFSKQASAHSVARANHNPAVPPLVSPPPAVHTPSVAAAPLQHRRPSLQLLSPLPNGVLLRKTANSCFEHYRILESVGSGTYANVWKVQKLPLAGYVYNGVSLAPSQLLPQPSPAALTPHLAKAPVQNTRTAAVLDEKGRSAAVSNVLLSSSEYLPKGCQQQPLASRRNSSCSVTGGTSSARTQTFRERQMYERKGPVDGQIYAAKLLQLDRFSADTLPRVLDMFSKEIVNLAKCQCPGVVRLHEVVEGKEGWLLVQDYIDGGTIWCEDICRDEDEAFLHFIQLLQAVLYLQEHNVLHRDLKPTNILRSKQSKRIVVADFGWSERLDCCRITPMEWPGTLEINPPEIITGTGPLTDRLDNYAVGMTLFLFLSSRFVCRQKGLDAATAAPYVLRTVHELRQGAPPAVFRGSGDAWTLFLGLTAPHPSCRWSLDQALAHTWVQQKLLLLGEEAFIWHPRVLQLTIALQREWSAVCRRGQGLPGGCISIPASSCNFESSVKRLSNSKVERSNVRWMPNRSQTGIVGSACAVAYTLQTAKRMSAAPTAAGAVQDGRKPTGQNNYANDAFCEQWYDVNGVLRSEWAATGVEQEAQATSLRQGIYRTSRISNIADIPPIVKPSPFPFVPHSIPSKGPHAERDGSCSRRQSMSICSTTDSFMTNLSFQQQQVSQRSSRGQPRTQTASSLLTRSSHVGGALAGSSGWQALLPCSVSASTNSVFGRAHQDSGGVSVLQRSIKYARNSSGLSTGDWHLSQQAPKSREMGVESGIRHQLHYVGETTDVSYGRTDGTREAHVPHSLGDRSDLYSRCHGTGILQVLPGQGEQQMAPLTTLQQHRPLPRHMLLSEFMAGGPVSNQVEGKEQDAEQRGTERSTASDFARANMSKRNTGPSCLPLQSSNHGMQTPATTRTFDLSVRRPAVYPERLPVSAAQCINSKTYDRIWMHTGPSDEGELIQSDVYAREQVSSAGLRSKTNTSPCATFTLTGRTRLAPLAETLIKEEDVHDTGSDWVALHSPQLSSHTERTPAADDTDDQKVSNPEKNTVQHKRTTPASPLLSAGKTLRSSAKEDSLQRSSGHTWRHDMASLWNAHLTGDLCNILGYKRRTLSTSSISTCDRTASHGQESAVTNIRPTPDGDITLAHAAAVLTNMHCKEQHLPVSAFASGTARHIVQHSSGAPLTCFSEPSQRCCVSSPKAAEKRSVGGGSPCRGGAAVMLSHGRSEGHPHPSSGRDRGTATYAALHDPAEIPHSRENTALPAPHEGGPLHQLVISSASGKAIQMGSGLEVDAPRLIRSPAMRRLPSPLSMLAFENDCTSREMSSRRGTTAEGTSGGTLRGAGSPIMRPAFPVLQSLSTTVRAVPGKTLAFPADSLSVRGITLAAAPRTKGELVDENGPAMTAQRSECDTDRRQRRRTSPPELNSMLGCEPTCASDAWWDIFDKAAGDGRNSSEASCRGREGDRPVQRQLVLSTSSPILASGSGASLLPAHSRLSPGALTTCSNAPDDCGDGRGDCTQANDYPVVRRDSKSANMREHQSSPVFPKADGVSQEAPHIVPPETHHQHHSPTGHSLRAGGLSYGSTVALDVSYQARATPTYDRQNREDWASADLKHALTQCFADQETDIFSEVASLDIERRSATAPFIGTAEVSEEITTKQGKANKLPVAKPSENPTVERLDDSSVSDREHSIATLEIPSIAVYVTRVADLPVSKQQHPESCTGSMGSPGHVAEDAKKVRVFRADRAGSQSTMKITGKLKFHDKRQGLSSSASSTDSSSENARRIDERQENAVIPHAPATPVQPNRGRAQDRPNISSILQDSFSSAQKSRELSDERIAEDMVTGSAVWQEGQGTCPNGVSCSKRAAQQAFNSASRSCSSAACTLVAASSGKRHHTREETETSQKGRSAAFTPSLSVAAAKLKDVQVGNDKVGNSVTRSPCAGAGEKVREIEENLIYQNTDPKFFEARVNTDADDQNPQLQYTVCIDQQAREEDFLYRVLPVEDNEDDQKNCHAGRVPATPPRRAASFPVRRSSSTRRTHDLCSQVEAALLCDKGRSLQGSLTACAAEDDTGNSAIAPFPRFKSEAIGPICVD